MLAAMRALLVVDHGSRRTEANAVLAVVEAKLAEALGPDVLLAHAHMELAAPSIADAVASLLARGATELFVQPWFLAPGRHAQEDIPRLVREALGESAIPLRMGEPMGADDELVRLALRRFATG